MRDWVPLLHMGSGLFVNIYEFKYEMEQFVALRWSYVIHPSQVKTECNFSKPDVSSYSERNNDSRRVMS